MLNPLKIDLLIIEYYFFTKHIYAVVSIAILQLTEISSTDNFVRYVNLIVAFNSVIRLA